MPMKRKYTDQQFVEAVASSTSIAQVLSKIGLKVTGANYIGMKMRSQKMGLDTSHFQGQGYLKGRTHNWSVKRPLNEILVENSDYSSFTSLKNRLIHDGLLELKCSECGINEWQGKKLVLQLEHKNGKKQDNRIENLCLLCPNCHSQTTTYAGRNRIKYAKVSKLADDPDSKSGAN